MQSLSGVPATPDERRSARQLRIDGVRQPERSAFPRLPGDTNSPRVAMSNSGIELEHSSLSRTDSVGYRGHELIVAEIPVCHLQLGEPRPIRFAT